MYPAHRSNISRYSVHVYTLIQLIRPIGVGRRQYITDPLTFSGNEFFSTVHWMPNRQCEVRQNRHNYLSFVYILLLH